MPGASLTVEELRQVTRLTKSSTQTLGMRVVVRGAPNAEGNRNPSNVEETPQRKSVLRKNAAITDKLIGAKRWKIRENRRTSAAMKLLA
jgi:hypothetical protein